MKKFIISLMILAIASCSFGIYNPTRFPNGLETNIISPDSTAKTNRGTLQINATTLNVRVLSFTTGTTQYLTLNVNTLTTNTETALTGITIGRARTASDEALDVMGSVAVESAPGVDAINLGQDGTITANKLVANGTNSKIELNSTALSPYIKLDGTNQQGIQYYTNGTQAWNINNLTSGALFFYNNTAGSNSLVLSQNGNVGIGTTVPSTKLEVAGTISTNGGVTARATATPLLLDRTDGSTVLMTLQKQGATNGYIGVNGTGLDFYNSSAGLVGSFTTSALNINGTVSASSLILNAQPYLYVYQAAAMTMATGGSYYVVTFDTQVVATNISYTTGTATISQAGTYLIQGNISAGSSASGTYRQAKIFVGATGKSGFQSPPSAASATSLSPSLVIRLAVNDTVSIRVANDNTGALTVNPGADNMSMTITKLF